MLGLFSTLQSLLFFADKEIVRCFLQVEGYKQITKYWRQNGMYTMTQPTFSIATARSLCASNFINSSLV